MFEVFGAIAAALAVAAPVVYNLGAIAQGGQHLFDFARRILAGVRKKVPAAQQDALVRQALSQAAAMPQLEFDKQAESIVEAVLADQSPEDRRAATEYLKLIPARIRSTFARPEDPSGTTVPATWSLAREEDLVPFLPPRPPRFKEGDTPPGANNWVLTERLGIGGFGEVWKARGKTMQNTFRAFKFCLDPVSQKSIIENEMVNIELVQNELADHPHVVKLLQANLDCDTPWLEYEYVEGGDLGQQIVTWGNDPEARARRAVEQLQILADTLAHCHKGFMHDGKLKRVIHRDMKHANVLIGKYGTLKITDFGISNTQARQALGEARIATLANFSISTQSPFPWANTPMYASPQQKNGEHPHPADDVHALGVMLYQMILGDINRPLNIDYISVLERKHVCRELISLLSQSIASDRDHRYQHAGELTEALKALPKKLVVEPGVISQVEHLQLYTHFDAMAADAQTKHATAQQQLDRRDWKGAVATLESIFHPCLRDADLYERAIAHRDGKRFINALGMEFVLLPKGTFWMGAGQYYLADGEATIDTDFFLGVYPVTQEEWVKVMGSNPSHFRKDGPGAVQMSGVSDADLKRFPVESVSWNSCQEFIRKVNEKMCESGWLYRLPREAEWEYACRGALSSLADCKWDYYFHSPTNTLSPQQANFRESHLGRTCNVGSYQPNALGIYDMHGLVWEWCENAYDDTNRVKRGGSWNDSAGCCRANHRGRGYPAYSDNNLGLRLARVPVR